jgi:Domain of unknown function (DUF4956)
VANVLPVIIDLIAIAVLVYPLYFRRYRRKDVLLALIATNVGVIGLTFMLAHTPLARTTGLGLGLIGVLRIIRFRSAQASFEEVAYFLLALALGLFCGTKPDPTWLTPVVAFALIAVVFVVDHPGINRNYRHQEVLLDRAFSNEGEMNAHLANLLNAEIHRATVRRLDIVQDTTLVDVRYRLATTANVSPVTRS